MKIKLIFLICLFVTFPIRQINAQKLWTLEECIGYALQNNITIKRQELQTEISKNNLTQSKIELLPDLSMSGNHDWGWGKSYNNSYQLSNKTSQGQFGINSSITIFSGFRKINAIKMNQYDFLSTLQNLEKIKNDISLNIASGYLNILYTKELYDVAESQLEVTKLQVDKTQKLYDVGNVAKGSLLDIQATAATEEANLTDAYNNLNLAYLNLAQMLDLDTVKNFAIFVPEEIIVSDSFKQNPDLIFYVAVERMPEIKKEEYSLLKLKSQLSMAKGARYPNLSLRAGFDTKYNFYDSLRINDQLDNNQNKSITLNLSVPLFSRYSIQKDIDNAKIGVQDAEYVLRQAQLQLRKDIEQAYANALASFQKFDVGLVNSVDYSVAKKNTAKAKSDLLFAKYDFLFKTKVLEFYKGNVIKL